MGSDMNGICTKIQSPHSLWSWRKNSTVRELPGRYVFSIEGISCMVTAVDPLLVLNCSMRFSSTLFSSTRGSRKLLTKAGLELAMLPDTEVIPMVLSGTVLCVLF